MTSHKNQRIWSRHDHTTALTQCDQKHSCQPSQVWRDSPDFLTPVPLRLSSRFCPIHAVRVRMRRYYAYIDATGQKMQL